MFMLRRVAPAATCAVFPAVAMRTHVTAKGEVTYRLDKTHPDKYGKEALAELQAAEERKKHPNPKSRKEELAHLLERPNYEYVTDFQRAANDMMAVQSDPNKYANDMAYHYQRISKLNSPSRTWSHEGNGAMEHIRMKPPQ